MKNLAHFKVPGPHLTPEAWIAMHGLNRECFVGPRDMRIPAFLPNLVRELCALRSSLEYLRISFDQRPEELSAFGEKLGVMAGQTGCCRGLPELIAGCLSRIDWREQDILEMMLELLGAGILGDPSAEPGRLSPLIRDELIAFQNLREQDRAAYERAVRGLISEMRGNLLGLPGASHALANSEERFPELDKRAVSLLIGALAGALGISPSEGKKPAQSGNDPARKWGTLLDRARKQWAGQGVSFPLKPFEKASLYLLELVPVDKPAHARFVRYLLEDDNAYRRILATCYADPGVQRRRLEEEVERFNRLPEHSESVVRYSGRELEMFLHAFMLRPDVVAATAERERNKDIYRVIGGLGPKAHLPRVIHEVQSVFGYVTPEAFRKIVDTLQLDPADVVRVIASYKQYSADPGGDIIIYLCKGTACFLRGQPDLSRRLAAEIEAEEGEVGRSGIQFIEMDCFGVCHLAPVVKARDTFLGRRTGEDIPKLLDHLLKGPIYSNRMVFLERIRRLLAPGRESAPLEEVRVLEVIGGNGADSRGAGQTEKDWRGSCLRIDASGKVFACRGEASKLLGEILPESLAFLYPLPDGTERAGCVVLDRAGQVRDFVNFSVPFLEAEIRKTIKPQAFVENDGVWMETAAPAARLRLGEYTANAVAVRVEEGVYRLIRLSGPPERTPPEKAGGLDGGGQAGEEDSFLSRQDRLVLDFTAGTDPDEIESYLANGGYGAVFRVLGLRGEQVWEPRRIVQEVEKARLRGRGGAGFPTGRKWEAMRLAKCVVQDGDENKDERKLIVANGDEGDPGAFMDRTLIQERPHQVIEGMILAALAVGARYGVIYVRKEYEDAVRRLEHALFQARRKGFLGRSIFGLHGIDFDLDIRLGAGAFVAGEKRAIMRAIEGEPAEPTLNAVSNTYRGLWGKPTLLNNVETFANVPLLIERGGEWYARQGTERSGGSKIFSVAGIVRRTGLVEVRFGRTLNDILRICGGIQEGKRLAGVQIGGPSGAILSLTGVRSYLLHTPLDFDAFDQVGAMLGSGGLVFIGEDDDVVRLARHFTDWLAEESCGQCPSCLQGTVSLGGTLDVILQGEGLSDHVHMLWSKSDAIKAGSRCGLGMTSANPVTSALRFFPHAFLYHILANRKLNRIELFRTLEALRLLTRGNVEKISARRRETIGYSFTLKKHLLRNLIAEIERLDQYQPSYGKRAGRFLELLQVPPHEVGARDAGLECTLEELALHHQDIRDLNYSSGAALRAG